MRLFPKRPPLPQHILDKYPELKPVGQLIITDKDLIKWLILAFATFVVHLLKMYLFDSTVSLCIDNSVDFHKNNGQPNPKNLNGIGGNQLFDDIFEEEELINQPSKINHTEIEIKCRSTLRNEEPYLSFWKSRQLILVLLILTKNFVWLSSCLIAKTLFEVELDKYLIHFFGSPRNQKLMSRMPNYLFYVIWWPVVSSFDYLMNQFYNVNNPAFEDDWNEKELIRWIAILMVGPWPYGFYRLLLFKRTYESECVSQINKML